MIVMMDPTKAVIFAIWFLLAQQVEGNVIYPHIVGSSVGLPAYVTLGGVFLGGAVAGIPGMVLIIPVISVIYQLLKEGRGAPYGGSRRGENTSGILNGSGRHGTKEDGGTSWRNCW